MSRPRLLVVTPRPPRLDGQGDQRRAHYAVSALAEDWDVEVVSWIRDGRKPRPGEWLLHPVRLVRAAALAAVRPVQVAYFQAWADRSLAASLPPHDLTLFVTDRAVPLRPKGPYVVDFVDDLAGAARSRAAADDSRIRRGLRPLLRWEAGRVRALDGRLANDSLLGLAVSRKDAAAIGPAVRTIPNVIDTTPLPPTGAKIVFTGNLFFPPNRDAGEWICGHLVPRLEAEGVDPGQVVVAGRRPPASLKAMAAKAGVDLRGDVADVASVLAEAAVVVVPVTFGSGAQNKVLDAVGAERPCVITSFTNEPFGLDDGRSALVRERTVDAFAEAILALRADPSLCARLTSGAREQLAHCTRAAVYDSWRRTFQGLQDRMVTTHSQPPGSGRRAGTRSGSEEHVDDLAGQRPPRPPERWHRGVAQAGEGFQQLV